MTNQKIWAPLGALGMALLLLCGGLAAQAAAGTDGSPFGFVAAFNGSGGYNGQTLQLRDPQGLAISNGTIYVGDDSLQSVLLIAGADVVSARIGGVGATRDLISRPVGLFWTPGALYVADTDKAGVMAYYGAATASRVGPLASAARRPSAVWVENRTLWMLDVTAGSLVAYDLDTGYNLGNHFGNGFGPDNLKEPQDIAVDAGHVYIADTGNNRVQVYDRQLHYQDSWGAGRGGLSLSAPRGVASDGQHLYVSDTGNDRIVVFGPDGYPLQLMGNATGLAGGLQRPLQLRLDESNLTLYVIDSGHARVVELALNWSNSQVQLLSDIVAVNASVQAYGADVIAPMDLLNVSHAPYDLPAEVSLAWQLAQVGQYANSANKLANVQARLSDMRLGQVQALRAAIQSRIDAALAVVAYYKGVPANESAREAQQRLAVRIDQAQHLLNDGQYRDAVQAVLQLSDEVKAYQQAMESARGTANDGSGAEVPATPQAAALLAQAGALQARIDALQILMQRLHQSVSLDSLQALVQSGQALAQTGDYEGANASLSAAGAQLTQLELAMDAQAADVDNASAELARAWKMVNDSQPAWQVVGLDSRPLVDKLVAAQALLYSQPQRARTMALGVEQDAAQLDSRAGSRGAALGWLGTAVVAIGALLVAAFALLRTRAPSGGGSWKDWMERRVRQLHLPDKIGSLGKKPRRGL